MSFEQLGLSADILHAISDQGYTTPTPIQAQAIPAILEGKDVMGGAQTGTGKTAGFTLPLLRRLEIHANTSMSPAKHLTRALILVPTRELAVQVHESVKTYGKYLTLRSAVIYGGVNMDSQIQELRAGVEILVATPGRLLDHIQQKTLVLSKIEILVLDEADRMLDMGFLPDLKRILELIPEQRQSLMFSATFSVEIKKLANKLLKQPILVEVEKRSSISELVTHVVHPVEQRNKQKLLVQLIKQQNMKQVLIFMRTKQGANQLAQQLARSGITTTAIHGDRNQLQRTQALDDFKQGVVQTLVATDVAARGLDIEDLPHVVNFELPHNPEDYVHRIGRTGRAGAKGCAISLVCEEENEFLLGIEKLLNKKLLVEEIEGFGQKNIQCSATTTEVSRSKPVQKRKKDYQTKFRGEVVRSNSARGNSNKGHSVQDPLFTQPYVPSVDAEAALAKQSALDKKFSHNRNTRHNKPLPALFIPPVVDKQK